MGMAMYLRVDLGRELHHAQRCRETAAHADHALCIQGEWVNWSMSGGQVRQSPSHLILEASMTASRPAFTARHGLKGKRNHIEYPFLRLK